MFHAESMVGKPLSLGDGSQIMRIVLLDAYTSLVLGRHSFPSEDPDASAPFDVLLGDN
mgnify:CR=1 FL=1